MEFKIEKQESKPLVEREEITLKITKSEITPSNAQIQEASAKLLKKPKELVIVKNIYQKFGMHESTALVYVYNSEEALKKFEIKTKKSKEVEKAKAEEKTEEIKEPPKEEPKIEEKSTEKKEEKPVERVEGAK